MKSIFRKLSISALLSIFVVTSTHSLVMASEQAAQAASPAPLTQKQNFLGWDLRPLQIQSLKVFAQLAAHTLYAGPWGHDLFFQHLDLGLREMRKQIRQEFKTLPEKEAQKQWEALELNAQSESADAKLIDSINAREPMSAAAKLGRFHATKESREIRHAVRAEVDKAGSVGKFLDHAALGLDPELPELPPGQGGNDSTLMFSLKVAALAILFVVLGVMMYFGISQFWGAIDWATLPYPVFGYSVAGMSVILTVTWIFPTKPKPPKSTPKLQGETQSAPTP